MISWRNPDARHADWGLDAYVAGGPGRAGRGRADHRRRAAPRWPASCSGGILASLAAAHLAAHRPAGPAGRVHPAGHRARQRRRPALPPRWSTEPLAAAAKAMSRRRGYLDGRALAEVFAWLRPGDLIWNYWVNNYLLGQTPAGVRHPVLERRHHPDDRRAARRLRRPRPGQRAGQARRAHHARHPIDLSRSPSTAYVVAGIADHITPWQTCYRSTQLLGGDTRFVLSTSGHIAAMVNPPTNPKATFQTNTDTHGRPQEWLPPAHTQQGSWWPDFADWLGERSGATTPAPTELGGGGLRPSPRPPAPTSTRTEEYEYSSE